MKITVLKEKTPGECRVALTPESVQRLIKQGHTVCVEEGAGESAGIHDTAYKDAGAHVCAFGEALFEGSKVTVCVNMPSTQDIAYVPPHSVLMGVLKPHIHHTHLKDFIQQKITAFSLELMPRITRAQSMDILSSQNNLCGYRAVIEASAVLNRAFPMMMTAAGTIQPAKVLIMGAGVSGLQAIATARRLGAVVSAFDVRVVAKEQVESLGATFIEVPYVESGEATGGYAKEMSKAYQEAQHQKLREVIAHQDVVITTAQIPMKKAPVLIDEAMVKVMKPASLILDLATDSGGNCALTRLGETIRAHDVIIQDASSIIQRVPYDASQLYARNIVNVITTLSKDDMFHMEDDIIKAICLAHDGHALRAHEFLSTDDC